MREVVLLFSSNSEIKKLGMNLISFFGFLARMTEKMAEKFRYSF